MSFSNAMENSILNLIFSGTSFPIVSPYPPLSVGLCTASPTDAGTGASCNEVPHIYGYERASTIVSDWGGASNGLVVNDVAIVFPEALASWGMVTHFAIFNEQVYGTGDMLIWGPLTIPKEIALGSSPRFNIDGMGANLD